MTAEKKYVISKTIDEAIAVSAGYEDTKFIAGGTDLMPSRFHGNDESSCLIDISEIDELSKVERKENLLRIGSCIKLDALKNISEVKKYFPALAGAANSVATPVIRKSATLGGNLLCENRCVFYNQSEFWRQTAGYCLKCDGGICIASGGKKSCYSKFVSDTAPVLIALNASVEIRDEKGSSIKKIKELYTGDGINSKSIGKNSLLTFILIPLDETIICDFRKLRHRQSIEFTSLTTAVSLNRKTGSIKIVIGGMDAKPVFVEGNINEKEELMAIAVKKPKTVDNDLFSRVYRKKMTEVFLKRGFEKIISET